jgi:hypothetical protein
VRADDVREVRVAPREEVGAVREEEIRGAEAPERLAQRGDRLEQARLAAAVAGARERVAAREALDQPVEEPAEGVLAVGAAQGKEPAAEREAPGAGQLAVVGEGERAPPQLAHERVDVGEAHAAVRLLADVGDADLGGDRVVVEEPDQRALGGGVRLAEDPRVAAVVEAHAPAVGVRPGGAAAPREAAERKDHVRRDVAVHAEQLAHAPGR